MLVGRFYLQSMEKIVSLGLKEWTISRTFSHRLSLTQSPVLEAVALVCALLTPDKHREVLDLAPFAPLIDKHRSGFQGLADNQRLRFNWLELALASGERQDLASFLKDIDALSQPAFLSVYLEGRISPREARRAMASTQSMSGCLIGLGLPADLSPILLDVRVLRLRLRRFLEDIWLSPAFSASLQQAKPAYAARLAIYAEGMDGRHPLSYAQELMGKPFWNIADYQHYEFVPVYFISPFRMRLMNSQAMIYIDRLLRIELAGPQQEAALSDAFKALGDATRLRILKLLYMKPMYGKEIADALGLSTATISHHLEALSRLGMLNLEQVKQIKYFSTNLKRLRGYQQELEAFIREKD